MSKFLSKVVNKSDRSVPLSHLTLVIILTTMLSGGFQIVSVFSRFALWVVWLVMGFIIFKIGKNIPIYKLIKPMKAMLIWFFIVYTVGVLVSPVSVVGEAIRTFTHILLISTSVAIIVSSPNYLRVFASYAQLGIVLNLVVTLLVINSSAFNSFLTSMNLAHAEAQLSSSRYSGLWGNANMAGLATLLILVLSFWAAPRMALIGRICGPILIYLTASRTAAWLLIAILFLYAVMALKKQNQIRLLIVISIGVMFVLSLGFFSDLIITIQDDPNVQRFLDVTEETTREGGYESRFDTLKSWVPALESGFFYGHGLFSMNGGGSMGNVFRTDIPYMGIHNLYLGILVDSGILGFVSFLIIIAYHLLKSIRIRFSSLTKFGIRSLFLLILTFSMFNHNMLSDMIGIIGYSFFYLLPSSPALISSRLRQVSKI